MTGNAPGARVADKCRSKIGRRRAPSQTAGRKRRMSDVSASAAGDGHAERIGLNRPFCEAQASAEPQPSHSNDCAAAACSLGATQAAHTGVNSRCVRAIVSPSSHTALARHVRGPAERFIAAGTVPDLREIEAHLSQIRDCSAPGQLLIRYARRALRIGATAKHPTFSEDSP